MSGKIVFSVVLAFLLLATSFGLVRGYAPPAGNPEMKSESVTTRIFRTGGKVWAEVDVICLYYGWGTWGGWGYNPSSGFVFHPLPPEAEEISFSIGQIPLDWSLMWVGLYPTICNGFSVAYVPIDNVEEDFLLRVHYKHPLPILNERRAFLYPLGAARYAYTYGLYASTTVYVDKDVAPQESDLAVYRVAQLQTEPYWATEPADYTITSVDGTWNITYVEPQSAGYNDLLLTMPPTRETVTVDTYPQPLSLMNKRDWFIGYIEIPRVLGGYEAADINVSTVILNDTVTAEPDSQELGDYDNDSIPELMINFNRTKVSEFLFSQDITFGKVTLVITGRLFDGTQFDGSATIWVKMPGDANCDGKVDVRDSYIVALAYGESPGRTRWSAFADENEDGKIDIRDVYLICKDYGKVYS